MTESEELIKLLTEEIGRYGVQCSETKELAPPKRLTELLSALAAQQQEPTEPVATEGYWWCPNCKAEIGAYHVTYQECHEDCGHKVEWITPVTAPLSGVREGMMLDALQRAQRVMHGEGVEDQGKAWDKCAQILDEAITLVAEQVNAEPVVRQGEHNGGDYDMRHSDQVNESQPRAAAIPCPACGAKGKCFDYCTCEPCHGHPSTVGTDAVVVPMNPTDSMLDAMKNEHWRIRGNQWCKEDYLDVYRAMIQAVQEWKL